MNENSPFQKKLSPKLVLVVHGIHTGRKEGKAWMSDFCRILESNSVNTEAVPFLYGWTSGFMLRLPWWGRTLRRRLVKRFQKFATKELRKRGPTWELSVVCHSMGTWIVHRSMTYKRGPRLFFDRIVYMGGVVSSREDFDDERGHFHRILNLFSKGDDVIRFAPFGHAGYKGFYAADGNKVLNKDLTPVNHDHYTKPGKGWKLAVDFLKQPPRS